MKILHTVQFYEPRVGGSEMVVKEISERLAARGHDVTVATFAEEKRQKKTINGVKIAEFKISGNSVFGITGEKEKYREFLVNGDYDVMMNYGSEIWSTDLVFPVLDEIRAKKIIVPLGFQGLKKIQCQSYYQKMPGYLQKYDKAIYLSPHYRDKDFADQHGLTNSVVIANGANEKEFEAPSAKTQSSKNDNATNPTNFRTKYGIKKPYFLLNVSNHYPNKGHRFLMEAFKKLKRDDVELVMIGGKPSNFWYFFYQTCYYECRLKGFLHKNIRFLDKISREDTVAAFKEADLFVFGSEFECSPLVIFEAMASRTPFISTDCGNVKDFIDYGTLIKTPSEMAQKINEWLENENRRKKIGEEAYQNWRQHYTWDKITDQYENLYRECLNHSSGTKN